MSSESAGGSPILRGYRASVVELEVHRDRSAHLDLVAVQYGGLVNPLADGIECGGHEKRMSAHDAQVAHVTVDREDGFDLDGALDAHLAGHRRIDGVDFVD